jgi:hypothetical protein
MKVNLTQWTEKTDRPPVAIGAIREEGGSIRPRIVTHPTTSSKKLTATGIKDIHIITMGMSPFLQIFL